MTFDPVLKRRFQMLGMDFTWKSANRMEWDSGCRGSLFHATLYHTGRQPALVAVVSSDSTPKGIALGSGNFSRKPWKYQHEARGE